MHLSEGLMGLAEKKKKKKQTHELSPWNHRGAWDNEQIRLCSKYSHAKSLIHILTICKLEQEQKFHEAGGSEEMLACKPPDFEKPVLSSTGLLIDAAWSS